MLNIIDKIHKNFKKNGVESYSQSGEDLIINFIFNALGLISITYLDIGAYDPIFLSNTYFFYEKGGYGVCIEPNCVFFNKLKKIRKRDVCLNIGIGPEKKTQNYYIKEESSLSSFIKNPQDKKSGNTINNQNIKAVQKIPVLTINEVLSKHFKKIPNLVCIDTEGYDNLILKSLDLHKYRPEVFCVETLSYSEEKKEKKIKNIISFMISKGYFLYADTYINSIFVEDRVWKNR